MFRESSLLGGISRRRVFWFFIEKRNDSFEDHDNLEIITRAFIPFLRIAVLQCKLNKFPCLHKLFAILTKSSKWAWPYMSLSETWAPKSTLH